MARDVKKRNWCFILYPESAPEDWFDLIQQSGLQGCVSPLHDKDVNPDGYLKKAHFHVILCYSGPTSFNVVSRFVDSLNQPIPQPIESVRGQYRYFTHLDNPDKYQYDEKDIRTINGFSIRDFVELTRSEVTQILKEIQSMIRELNIMEYSDLMDKLLDEDLTDYYDVSCSHTYFLEKYISSRRNKVKELIKNL